MFPFKHFIHTLTRRYYHEDFIRVYPDGILFNRFGKQYKANSEELKNFINHSKFYEFAAQFVKGKTAADIGCGSGYGCDILKKAGAARVYGADASAAAVRFARGRYGDCAEFSIQDVTDLNKYEDDMADVAVASEVLEHVKEYGVEDRAIGELKRITRSAGLIIIGTPNNEMLLKDHGFFFDEIDGLLKNNFSSFCIFENALVPYDERKRLWEKRVREGRTGVIVSENVDISETVILKETPPEIKKGIPPGIFKLGRLDIDTSLLHNTHSWTVVAVNSK